MSEQKEEKKVSLGVVIKSILFILVAVFLFCFVAIYLFNFDNSMVRKSEQVVPFPMALVGTGMVSAGDVESNLLSAKKFYENQDFSDLGLRVDFTTDEGRKRLLIKRKNILNKMIEDKVVEAEARSRGIELTKEMIDQEVDRKLKEYGSQQYLKDNLEKLYGWDIEDFKKNIVKPDMYRKKLFEDAVKKDKSFSEGKEKIEKASKELEKGGEFSRVAGEYSQGESAKKGGDLGWFTPKQMLPEIAEEVQKMEIGGQSGIIQSPLGYHIVRLEDKKTEDGEDSYKLSQIFVRTKTLAEMISDWEKNTRIIILPRGLFWDKKEEVVEFSDPEMRDFEENLDNNSPQDASLLF